MVPPSRSAAGIAFGRYRLFAHRRELLCDDEPVKLGDRALDVLMVLIKTPGALIDKDVLMARVWPNRVVEEGNLQAQITALRKALGSDRELIRTVVGRGYLFTGEIHTLPAISDQPVRTAARRRDDRLPPTNIPQPISELIGQMRNSVRSSNSLPSISSLPSPASAASVRRGWHWRQRASCCRTSMMESGSPTSRRSPTQA
jgi:DNA-binding winged helix-turn-helix (wHTH) protein